MVEKGTIVVQPWSKFTGTPDGKYGYDDFYFIKSKTGPHAVDEVTTQGLGADGQTVVTELNILLQGHKLQPTDSVYRHPDRGLIVRRPMFWDAAAGFPSESVFEPRLLGHDLVLALAHFSRRGHSDQLWGETDPGKPGNQTVLPYNFQLPDDVRKLAEVVIRMIDVKKDPSRARDPLEVTLISRVPLADLGAFRDDLDRLETKVAGGVLERTMLRVEKNPIGAFIIFVYASAVVGGAFKQGLRGALLHMLSFNPENPVLLPWARDAAVSVGKSIAGASSTAVRGAAAELSAGGRRYLLGGAAGTAGLVGLNYGIKGLFVDNDYEGEVNKRVTDALYERDNVYSLDRWDLLVVPAAIKALRAGSRFLVPDGMEWAVARDNPLLVAQVKKEDAARSKELADTLQKPLDHEPLFPGLFDEVPQMTVVASRTERPVVRPVSSGVSPQVAPPKVVRETETPKERALLRSSLLAAKRYKLTDVSGYLIKLQEDQIEAFARSSLRSWEDLLRVNGFGNYADQLKAAGAKPNAIDTLLLSLAAMADSRRDVEAVIRVMAREKRVNFSPAAGLPMGGPIVTGPALPAPSPISVLAH